MTAVARHDDGVEVAHRRRPRHDASTASSSPPTPTRPCALLADATVAEKDDLGAIGYSANETWLHRDASVLPAAPRARASWNYRMRPATSAADRVVVSYWMNRLQGLDDADDHLVTLNPHGRVDPATVLARMTYAHPVFTHEAVAAPAAAAHGRAATGCAFAGAHLGWGFHEDGCRSGCRGRRAFGVTW